MSYQNQIAVVAQRWEESDAQHNTKDKGWTLHLSMEDCSKYVTDYSSMVSTKGLVEHDQEVGSPILTHVSVDTYNELVKHKTIRVQNLNTGI